MWFESIFFPFCELSFHFLNDVLRKNNIFQRTLTWCGKYIYRWCIIELYSWSLYHFISQSHPDKFNKKRKTKVLIVVKFKLSIISLVACTVGIISKKLSHNLGECFCCCWHCYRCPPSPPLASSTQRSLLPQNASTFTTTLSVSIGHAYMHVCSLAHLSQAPQLTSPLRSISLFHGVHASGPIFSSVYSVH